MSRPDQSITFLRNLGYSVLLMPRSDVRPSQTLQRVGKKDLRRLGEITTIMTAGANPPAAPSTDNIAPAGISGKESSTVKVEIGLTVLGNIIQAFGGGNLGVTTGFERAKTVTFRYDDVLEDHISVDQLDQYLTTASARRDGKGVLEALIQDEVYVITSTIKSQKLTVSAQSGSNTKVGLDVPVIQQVASGNLKVDVARAAEGQVTYEGKVPIVFGFQAVQLFYDDEANYTTFNPLDPGGAAMKAAGATKPTLLTLDEGVFFRMEDEAQAAGR